MPTFDPTKLSQKSINMIAMNPTIYTDLATLLLRTIDEHTFFNGSIELDSEEFYSTLRCTLIICREVGDAQQGGGEILSILPVWWEYDICTEQGDETNDFSWKEFSNYLNC